MKLFVYYYKHSQKLNDTKASSSFAIELSRHLIEDNIDRENHKWIMYGLGINMR